MVVEKFNFSWDAFASEVPNTFKQLWNSPDFADVTLATKDGVNISAHKVILSASSTFFKDILRRNPHSNPLIYFNNLKSAEVNLLLQFIYLGHCEVGQDGLMDFLAAGKELMVNGLTEERPNIDQDFLQEDHNFDQNIDEDISLSYEIFEQNPTQDITHEFDKEKNKSVNMKPEEGTCVIPEDMVATKVLGVRLQMLDGDGRQTDITDIRTQISYFK